MKKILLSLLLVCGVSVFSFADLRKGALPGEFYVSPTTKVHFASGNFQSGSYANRLAEHQYDYVGASNRRITSSWSYNGYFDLFGWGQGYRKYTTDSTAYANYIEWGEYPLTNADNDAQWRTLTKDEWEFLLFSSPAQVGFATVVGVKGLLLLPGGVLPDIEAAGLSFVPQKKEEGQWETVIEKGILGIKSKNTYFTDNEYDTIQWKVMDQIGAVFLPAACYRTTSSSSSTDVDAVLYDGLGSGYYWTSTPVEGQMEQAYHINFGIAQYPSGEAHVYRNYGINKKRYTGMSVRLVTENAEYNPVIELDPIKVDTDGEAEIFFNYSGPSSSSVLQTLQEDDFYNDDNSCLMLCTPLQDAVVDSLMDDVLQNTFSGFSSVFSGVSFFLPAGSGEIKLDMCTCGFPLSVHIGDAVAHLTQNERGEAVVTYNIPEPTLVCMHALDIDVISGARRRALRTSAERPRVELYRMKISANASEGVEGVQDNALCEKIFRDGQLLILRGDKSYTVTGQELK